MSFPIHRSRRLRRTSAIRSMVQETRICVDQLVMPLFVCPGSKVRREIGAMPGNYQLSVDQLVETCKGLLESGLKQTILFGIPDRKDSVGTAGYAANGVVPTAIAALKQQVPEMTVWADVCLCEYTDHGHCGVLKNSVVDNDPTLALLAKAAACYADAGADVVAPSDMMDGRVGRIRRALDDGGHTDTIIVSYAAKYASAFYGPFREAAESPPAFGDRKGYQMDPANRLEALKEVAADVDEGADVVMVKPALPYLDIVREVRNEVRCPVAAYNVSGEFSMIHAAAAKGWLDLENAVMESLMSIRRAGADIILTYFAPDAARYLLK